MNSIEYDFSTVRLEQVYNNPNIVYELGKGVIPELATAFGIELDEQANPDNMGALIDAIGPKKTLRDNETQVESVLEDAVPTAANWVDDSGIMVPIDRGLWQPEQSTPEDTALIVMGGVPNWIRRSAMRAIDAPQTDVVIAAGGRVMNRPTDLANEFVQEFIGKNQRKPTESEFFDRYYKEVLEQAGKNVSIVKSDATFSHEVFRDMFNDKKLQGLIDRNLAGVRVANAALAMALQIRLAGRELDPGFDSEDDPQMFAISDEFPLARTKEDAKKPNEFQSPVTALRQIPVAAKELLNQN